VALAPITSSTQILDSIANSIEINISNSDTGLTEITNHLQYSQVLLVIDNFKHVIDGAELVQTLVTSCSNLQILVTSREKLGVADETIHKLNGLLSHSDTLLEDAVHDDAVRLFVQIATRINWNFKLTDENWGQVVRICQIVSGVPLAIELLAAWTRIMSLSEIIDRLDTNYDVIGDSIPHAPQRHQNIQAVFESSWVLLTYAEQRLYCQLSVFRGGFTADSYDKVIGASAKDMLSFYDKSLLYHDDTGRFHIHELLRQYAEDKLTDFPDLASTIHYRHALYYAEFLLGHEMVFKQGSGETGIHTNCMTWAG